MTFFKPKQSLPLPAPPAQPPSLPPHHHIHQAITTLQTHLSNFLQNLPTPLFPTLNPLPFAKISSTNTTTIKKSSMSSDLIEERLGSVPVYALSNGSQEFVLLSGVNTGKSLGLFCLSEADAVTLLDQMRSVDPSMRSGSQVVPVALSKIFQLKDDGVALRLIPEVSEIKNALEVRKRAGISDESFPGVPVFQSRSLILRSQNKRYLPVFFRKEDLEKSLSRASRQQRRINPALREGDIQVAVLEDIIRGMKDSAVSWDEVVFIPPGFDVSTDPSSSS